MPTFHCRLSTPEGAALRRTLVADSRSAAKALLEKEGFFVLDIRQERAPLIVWSTRNDRRKIKRAEFYAFCQEFAVLLRAGLPVVAALDAVIEKRERSGLREILQKIRDDVAAGESLSVSFWRHPQVFSHLFVASLQAGEKTGDIPSALRRHTEYLKKAAAIRGRITTASIYPAILTVASLGVLFFLLAVVVPAFTTTFKESGTELPGITRALMALSDALRGHWVLLIAGLAILVAGSYIFRKSEKGRAILDRWRLGLPFLGGLSREYAAARMARTMSTLLAGGTPLVETVRISAAVLDNRHLLARMAEVVRRIEEGAGFAESLRHAAAFPELAIKMVAAGERGGALVAVLGEVADFYDSEVENRLSVITSTIEPALMVVMGLMIGFIVLALYMPVFQLAGAIS